MKTRSIETRRNILSIDEGNGEIGFYDLGIYHTLDINRKEVVLHSNDVSLRIVARENESIDAIASIVRNGWLHGRI